MQSLLDSLNRIDQKLEQIQALEIEKRQRLFAFRATGETLLAQLQHVIDEAPKVFSEVL